VVVLHATASHIDDFNTLQQQAQTQLQWWAELVQVTGGELNPKKCCGLVYAWKPDKNGILCLQQPNLPTDFLTLTKDNTTWSILSPKIMKGCDTSDFTSLWTGIPPQWRSTCGWKPNCTLLLFVRPPWIAMKQVFLTVPALSLHYLTLYQLHGYWIPSWTRYIGYQWYSIKWDSIVISHGVWCLPQRAFGGIGMGNLQTEMEVQQIMILHHPMQAKMPLGQAIEILICQYQLWARVSEPILQNTTPYSWVLDWWLSWIQQMMYAHNIQICYLAWVVTPLWSNDVFLMEAIQELNLTQQQLEQINACCMYLQVTMLAKIVDHTGTTILLYALSLHPSSEAIGLQSLSKYLDMAKH